MSKLENKWEYLSDLEKQKRLTRIQKSERKTTIVRIYSWVCSQCRKELKLDEILTGICPYCKNRDIIIISTGPIEKKGV